MKRRIEGSQYHLSNQFALNYIQMVHKPSNLPIQARLLISKHHPKLQTIGLSAIEQVRTAQTPIHVQLQFF